MIFFGKNHYIWGFLFSWLTKEGLKLCPVDLFLLEQKVCAGIKLVTVLIDQFDRPAVTGIYDVFYLIIDT